MQDDFPQLAQDIVGPALTRMGFALAGVDSIVDDCGRNGSL